MATTNYKALAAHLPFDISVEALAGELLANGGELSGSDQIMVRPGGHLSRAGAREVTGITGATFNAAGKEIIYIDINREGIFDTLPEMLFIPREGSYEDDIDKAQQLARQQALARRFLLPFEEEFYRARIEVARSERSFANDLAAWLLKIVGLALSPGQAASHAQLRSFALALPFAHRIRGNHKLTGSLLSTVLGKRITIAAGAPQTYAIPEAQQSQVGEAILGVDLVLGESFTDGIRCLRVTVEEVSPEEVELWLPGGRLRTLLEEQLLPHLLPAGEQIELSICTADSESSLVLDDIYASNILGYSTTIF